jgi:hypothetical protein
MAPAFHGRLQSLKRAAGRMVLALSLGAPRGAAALKKPNHNVLRMKSALVQSGARVKNHGSWAELLVKYRLHKLKPAELERVIWGVGLVERLGARENVPRDEVLDSIASGYVNRQTLKCIDREIAELRRGWGKGKSLLADIVIRGEIERLERRKRLIRGLLESKGFRDFSEILQRASAVGNLP